MPWGKALFAAKFELTIMRSWVVSRLHHDCKPWYTWHLSTLPGPKYYPPKQWSGIRPGFLTACCKVRSRPCNSSKHLDWEANISCNLWRNWWVRDGQAHFTWWGSDPTGSCIPLCIVCVPLTSSNISVAYGEAPCPRLLGSDYRLSPLPSLLFSEWIQHWKQSIIIPTDP